MNTRTNGCWNKTMRRYFFKAIAFGANAFLIASPVCFGSTSGGAEGVTKTLKILRAEFEMAWH